MLDNLSMIYTVLMRRCCPVHRWHKREGKHSARGVDKLSMLNTVLMRRCFPVHRWHMAVTGILVLSRCVSVCRLVGSIGLMPLTFLIPPALWIKVRL